MRSTEAAFRLLNFGNGCGTPDSGIAVHDCWSGGLMLMTVVLSEGRRNAIFCSSGSFEVEKPVLRKEQRGRLLFLLVGQPGTMPQLVKLPNNKVLGSKLYVVSHYCIGAVRRSAS